MNIVITGQGPSVYFLARRFVSKGHKLTLITDNAAESDYYSRNLKAVVLYGDSTDPEVLSQADLSSIDLVVAMNSKDQECLVVCQLAKLHRPNVRILAVINDPDNREVFSKLGIKAISATDFLIEVVDNQSVLDDIRQQTPMAEGKILATEVEVSASSKCANKELKDLNNPYEALIACIIRNNDVIIPRGGTKILPGDRLLLISLPDTHSYVINFLI